MKWGSEMKLGIYDLDWSAIESADNDDNNFVQMAFAHYRSGDEVCRWYWVSGKKDGKWFEKIFDDPESMVNKSNAYDYYWKLESKIMGHYEFS